MPLLYQEYNYNVKREYLTQDLSNDYVEFCGFWHNLSSFSKMHTVNYNKPKPTIIIVLFTYNTAIAKS